MFVCLQLKGFILVINVDVEFVSALSDVLFQELVNSSGTERFVFLSNIFRFSECNETACVTDAKSY